MRTLKSKKAFERVFKQGRRGRTPLVRVTALACQEGEEGRIAFVAAKRLGNAVHRNRCKRVMREAARASELPPSGYDLILFATDKTHCAAPDDLRRALGKALKKAGVETNHGEQ